MKIQDAKIVSFNRENRTRGGFYIDFTSSENIKKGDYVEMIFETESHYFEVTDISIEGQNLKVSAIEEGYWARKFDQKKDFDLRKMIGIEVNLVLDEKTKANIYKMSCWC